MASRRQFRFIKEIARGGFGTVYMAEMVTGDNFSTVVAIKLLHAQWADHEEILMRSRDEARLLGRLRHRSIVRVEDLTYIQGHCAVIMEYLEGADLKSLMGFLGGIGEHIPARFAFEVTAQVASALEAAYNYVPLQGGEPLRLVHRDIKPSNVMVTVDGDVKLLDFGTARANFDSREAHTESLAFGSQAYMAPERFMGDPDAPAGDIFSLGVSLYELLSGQNIGRILLREDRFYDNLDERLAALSLEGLPEEIRHEARKVMRLMMDYDAENRPTGGQVVELMEVLAEKAQDASLRRFSRKHVRSALEASPHVPGKGSLQGNTLVEDRSATYDTTGFRAPKEDSEEAILEPVNPTEAEEPSIEESLEQGSDEVAVPIGDLPSDGSESTEATTQASGLNEEDTLSGPVVASVDSMAFAAEESHPAVDESVEDKNEVQEASGDSNEAMDAPLSDAASLESVEAGGGSDSAPDEASLVDVTEPHRVEEKPVPVVSPPPLPSMNVETGKETGIRPASDSSARPVRLAIVGALIAVVGGGIFVGMGSGTQEAEEQPENAQATAQIALPPEPPEIEQVENQAPIASAGPDLSVRLGRTASLSGQGEDPDEGAELSYAWSLVSAPSGSTAAAEGASEELAFKPDKVGSYELMLTVSDGVDEATDSVTVTVTAPPRPGSIRVSLLPVGGAEAFLKGPNGVRYACPKNPHCIALEKTGLEPGNYTLSFTPRGQIQSNRTVNVRSGKECVYNVSGDFSVVQVKCE